MSHITLTNTVSSVAGKSGSVSLVKGDVGLGNVDNTSDANKPVSTAQAAAIAAQTGTFAPLAADAGGVYYASLHAGATTDLKVTAALASCVTAGGGTVVLPGGVITDWAAPVRLPAGLTAGVLIRGANSGGTTIRLSAQCPRAFDFDRTTTGQTFKNLALESFTVDANNIDGPSRGPLTSVSSNITLTGGGASTDVPVASSAGWQPSGAAHFETGAAAGRNFAVTAVGSGTVRIRNDGSSYSLVAGDTVVGACVDHVVIGTWIAAGSVDQSAMNFDNITIRRIQVKNVAVQQSTTPHTHRYSIALSPRVSGNITNICVEDVDIAGGSSGVEIGIPGQTPANGFVDHILLRRVRHDVGVTPTMSYPCENFLIGGAGKGGIDIRVQDCRGYNSGDVGLEIDSCEAASIVDTIIEDAYGGAFFSTSFNRSAVATAVTTLNVGATLSAVATTITVASTAGFNRSGWLVIDNELIFYTGTTGTTFTNCIRGAYATSGNYVATTHADTSTVTQWDPANQLYTYTRCHARRSSASTGIANFSGFGFYNLRLNVVPPPALKLIDCSSYRNNSDLGTTGEAIHIEGGTRSLEIERFRATLRGSHATLDGTQGALVYLTQDANNNITALNVPTPVVKVRGFYANIQFTLASGASYPRLAGFLFDRGAWNVDIDDVDWFCVAPSAQNGSTLGMWMPATAPLFVRGVVSRFRVRTPGTGDLTPNGINIPSGATIQGLVIRSADFRELTFATPSSLANYLGFNINSANMAKIRFERTIHPSSLTTSPMPNTTLTVGASPYAYQNLDGYRQRVTAAGGTVSDVSVSQDGSTYTTTGAVAGPFDLEPGEYLRVTYSSVPAMTKQSLN